MARKKGHSDHSRHTLAQVDGLDALVSQLQDPLPPMPKRLVQSSSRTPPVSFTSPSNATDPYPSRLFPDSVQPTHDDRYSSSDTSEMTRVNDRLAKLDADISVLIAISSAGSLSFIHHPKNQARYQRLERDVMTEPNTGHHALLPRALVNQHFLNVESKLCTIYRELEVLLSQRLLLENQKVTSEKLATRVEDALIALDTLKEVEWHRQRPVSPGKKQRVINSGFYFAPNGPSHPTLIAIYITVLTMHILYHVPRDGIKVLLSGMQSIAETSADMAKIARDIPSDPRKIISLFRLDPVTRAYLCCPSCFSMYPYVPDNPAAMPQTCQRSLDPSEPALCGASLWRTARIESSEHQVPIKKFLHQEMGDWLGRLLSRPGVEDCLENPCFSSDEILCDIWDGTTFRELKGPDGKLFLPGPKNELRLVFALSLDGFNPFHNKTAKSSYSSTSIWLILLNFPPTLRHLPHNRYPVGVLPGRKAPSLDQINPVLDILIDDWLPFFDPGVWISRTAKYALGRSLRCHVAILVADQDAARQTAGFADFRATEFCSRCRLPKKDIHNLNRAEWPQRDLEEHMRSATAWRDAPSRKEQNSLYKQTGIRWTPLLRIPGFNPIRRTDLESMHVFDLNILDNQLRQVWKIDPKADDGEGTGGVDSDTPPRPTPEDMARCARLLSAGGPNLHRALENLPRAVLWHACRDRSLRTAGTKWQLAQWLLSNRTEANSPSRTSATPAESSAPDGDNEQDFSTAPSTTTEQPQASSTRGSADPEAMDVDPKVFDYNAPPGKYGKKDVRDRVRSTTELQQVSSLSAAIRDGVGFKKLTKDYGGDVFRYLCLDRRLDFTQTKEKMFTELLSWTMQHESGGSREPRTSGDRVVFGKQTIDAVRDDIKNCQLPSWVGSVPLEWALLEKAKLSANQWRVIFTVHLPFTLIRLWGLNESTERRKLMLSNALDLVRSVILVNLRELSPGSIEEYESTILRYLSTLIDLYKDIKLLPSHHAALHMGEPLRELGPVHAHSAPHYERDIHMMQELNTNGKSGELEATMMNSSGRSANLKAILSDDPNVRRHVSSMIKTWETVSSWDARGTRLASLVDPMQPPTILVQDGKESTMSDYIHQMLVDFLNEKHRTTAYADQGPAILRHIPLSRRYRTASKVHIKGVRYCTSQSIVGDSHVIFQASPEIIFQASPKKISKLAGSIAGIFEHTHEVVDQSRDNPFFPRGTHNPTRTMTSVFLQVQAYAPIQDAASTPLHLACLKEGFVGGWLRRNVLGPIQLIDASQVVSHFRLLPVEIGEEKLIHVYPLDRLMSAAFTQQEETV